MPLLAIRLNVIYYCSLPTKAIIYQSRNEQFVITVEYHWTFNDASHVKLYHGLLRKSAEDIL